MLEDSVSTKQTKSNQNEHKKSTLQNLIDADTNLTELVS
jgi:hypothetical protein